VRPKSGQPVTVTPCLQSPVRESSTVAGLARHVLGVRSWLPMPKPVGCRWRVSPPYAETAPLGPGVLRSATVATIVHGRPCYLLGCNRVTFSGLSPTLAAAASAASAKPGTDSLSRARNSRTALSMISWDVRAPVKPAASCSSRRIAAVARYPICSAGSGRAGRPRRRGASSGTPPPSPPTSG
jgi:hypothetical protein